jgi:predicted O-methyltransferase YrrM
MNPDQWNAVDAYFSEQLVQADAILDSALAESTAAGLPAINVAPNQGKLLMLLAQVMGARRILEIGTLGGYSTIWLARALPADGTVVTLELDPKHAAVAQANFTRAGLNDRIQLRVGPARDSLTALIAEQVAPFDLVFIDADKISTPEYLRSALHLTQPGSLIIIDNVVRNGAVTDAGSTDPSVQGVREALAMMNADPRLSATALQTVGSKGYDGLAMALVVER